MDIWLTAGAVTVLLILSGFFSGSETALTAASRAKIHQLAEAGNKRADIVNRLRENKERLIGAILLGNNLVNILATALASSLLIQLFGEAGVAYATLGMTVLVLIFAEVLPKTYAIRHADNAALLVSPIIRAVVFILAPITGAITGVVRVILKALGDTGDQVGLAGNLEELKGAIELHRAEDEVEKEEIRHERAMLRSVLELQEIEVGEIMTHRREMVTIDIGLPNAEIVDQVLSGRHTRIPVYENEPDNVIGVLHAKDLLRAVRAVGDDMDALDIRETAAKPWFIPDTTSLFDQLHEFRERREHFSLVIDEYGALQGVVTLEDILEEIVGEIDDEHDAPVSGVRRQGDGSYLVQGSVTIRDLNREFEWKLPTEDYSTAAGLVLHEARRIPEVGQQYAFYGLSFEILRRQRNQITLLRIRPLEVDTVPEGGEAADN
ncbi:MAG: HlyC/CorC family transporter [Alphaproteobacteria bacterium]|nr:HlyC/CorC family transporter [Alphaproteobacteria bacterium SS10]